MPGTLSPGLKQQKTAPRKRFRRTASYCLWLPMNSDLTAKKPKDAVPLSVVVKRIKAAVAQVSAGWVEAEINKVAEKSGHFWFELAGGEDSLKAVMWRRDARRVTRDLPEPLAKGQKIHARYDRIDFYGPHGALRIVISDIRFVGEGELLRRRTESLERLRRDGLCDKKRPLPAIPRCIGLIAGRESEGQFDVVDAIAKRWPPAQIKFVPSLVQGTRAPEQLISSLLMLEADPEVDVIAVCRGGGSVQDLLAFDDEELCRIIANIETPVVAAIGHSRNRPNAYYVADAEAAVPQAAAELLVPAEADHLRVFDQALRVIGRELAQTSGRTSLIENLHKRLERFLGLEGQRSRLQQLDAELQARGGMRLRASAAVLEGSRQAIETARHRIPRADAFDAPKARLRAATERVMRDERKALIDAEQSIPMALSRIPSPSTLNAQAARLGHSANRSCKEQRTTFNRLGVSLDGDIRRSRRSATTAKEQVGSLTDRLCGSAGRSVGRVQRDLDGKAQHVIGATQKHLDALGDAIVAHMRQIAALDPSARGFALIRTHKGGIVDSANALQAGQAIRLELHDGSAEAHIDRVAT
jgi:exodeoxyribonuclease VII large subunit